MTTKAILNYTGLSAPVLVALLSLPTVFLAHARLPETNPPAATTKAVNTLNININRMPENNKQTIWGTKLPPGSMVRVSRFATTTPEQKNLLIFTVQPLTASCEKTKICDTRTIIGFDEKTKNGETNRSFHSYINKDCLVNKNSTMILTGIPKASPVLSCPKT